MVGADMERDMPCEGGGMPEALLRAAISVPSPEEPLLPRMASKHEQQPPIVFSQRWNKDTIALLERCAE